MNEKTRELLEKNQSLLKALVRLPGAGKSDPDSFDEVDRFFAESVKRPLNESPDIVKNDERLRARTFNEEQALSDVEFLSEMVRKAWKSREISDLVDASKRLYGTFLPGFVAFSVSQEGDLASGIGAYGKIKQYASVIRKMKIPLFEQSVLRDVVITGELYRGPLFPSTWNNFIAARIIHGRVCPVVIALPVIKEKGVKEVILTGELPEDYSELRIGCLKIFVFQMRLIAREIAKKNFILDL